MNDEMDTRRVLDILNSVKVLAEARKLTRNDDVREDVLRLKNFSEYRCKMDDEAYGHAYAAAAQAWILVSGSGNAHYSEVTHERAAEFCELAIDRLAGTLDIHPARLLSMM